MLTIDKKHNKSPKLIYQKSFYSGIRQVTRSSLVETGSVIRNDQENLSMNKLIENQASLVKVEDLRNSILAFTNSRQENEVQVVPERPSSVQAFCSSWKKMLSNRNKFVELEILKSSRFFRPKGLASFRNIWSTYFFEGEFNDYKQPIIFLDQKAKSYAKENEILRNDFSYYEPESSSMVTGEKFDLFWNILGKFYINFDILEKKGILQEN